MTAPMNEKVPGVERQYAQREVDSPELMGYYLRHVSAMTGERLHAKSDIAAELAWRDAEIDRLRALRQGGGEAVAWACWSDAGLHRLCATEADAKLQAHGRNWRILPLYASPSPASEEPT